MRQAEARRRRNRVHRSALRTAVKRVRVAGSREEAMQAFRTAQRLLDRAARKHLVHPNLVARTKARLFQAVQTKE